MKITRPLTWFVIATGIALLGGPLYAQDDVKADDAQPSAAVNPNIRLRLEIFSLSLQDAHGLILTKNNGAEQYAAMEKLLAEGKAEIERFIVLPTKNGIRCNTLSAAQFRQATAYGISSEQNSVTTSGTQGVAKKPKSEDAKHDQRPFAAKFEMQNLGDSVDYEPTIGPDGKEVNLSVSIVLKKLLGTHKAEEVSRPLVQVEEIATDVSMKIGEPFSLGTLSPPTQTGTDGDNADNRVWIVFATMTK